MKLLKRLSLGLCSVALVCSSITFVPVASSELGNLINEVASDGSENRVHVESVSTQHSSDRAANTLDKNTGTIWHSNWSDKYNSANKLPSTIVYDLTKTYDLTNLSFLPRNDSVNGDIFEFDLYVGDDINKLKIVEHYVMETTGSGTGESLKDKTVYKQVDFNASGRYVKMVITRSGHDNPDEENYHTSMAEINFYGDEHVVPSEVNKNTLTALVKQRALAFENSSAYTNETYEPFAQAYNDTKALLETNASQVDINNQINVLNYYAKRLMMNERELGTLINTEASDGSENKIHVESCTSQYSGEGPENTLDKNTGSIWHSDWSGSDTLPISVVYDLTKTYNLTDIEFLARQNGSNNGDILQFDLYTGESEEQLVYFGHFVVSEGNNLTNKSSFQRVTFDAVGRYVKITVTHSAGDSEAKRNKFAAMAEIRFYGAERIEETEDDDGFIYDVDMSVLGDLIDDAESNVGITNDYNEYTTNSFTAYINAYNAALEVYDTDVSQEIIDEAYNNLLKAMKNLVIINVLKENIAIKTDDLTYDHSNQSDVWKEGYQTLLNKVTEISNNANVTQEEVDAADELLSAIIEYANLYEKVNVAQALDTTDKTTGSVEYLNQQIENAQDVLDDLSITYDDIIQTIDTLTIAINGLMDKYQLRKETIEIVEIGNQQAEEPLSNIFDENTSSLWHTNWKGSNRKDHYFILEVPLNYYDRLELLPRPQNGVDGDQNGVIQELKVYVKLGESGDWVEVAHRDDLNANGYQVVTLDSSVKGNFIKVEVLDADSSNAMIFASLAELKIFYQAKIIDRSKWQAAAFFSNGSISEYKDNLVPYEKASDTNQNEGPVEYMFDNSLSTIYHTDYDYASKDYYDDPIEIILKLNDIETFNYFDWLNRVGNEGCRLANFEIYTIDDLKDYTNDRLKTDAPWVKKFAFSGEADKKYVKFYIGEQTTKYVKIVCTSHDTNHHICCADFNLLYVSTDEIGEIRYSGMNTTLNSNYWIQESAYDQYKGVQGYYGIVEEQSDIFSDTDANLIRYVTSSVLSIKAQSLIDENDKADVRFVTSVASTNLERLRFKVEIIKPDGLIVENFVETNRVFGTIVADNVRIEKAADVFGNNSSKYFAVCKLNNIPRSAAQNGTKVRVTPYWAPSNVAEGDYDNYIEGISRTFNVQDFFTNASGTQTMNE